VDEAEAASSAGARNALQPSAGCLIPVAMSRGVFDALQMSWWGTFIRESTMGFAIASVFLLFGITLLLGGVFLMSLRLLGLFMTDYPVSQVARGFRKWIHAGLVLSLISGVTMAMGHGVMPDLYESTAFWLEMKFLVVALLFHFTLYQRVTTWDDVPAGLRALTATLSLLLWFGVGVAGRAIGFF
jgi:uncharacterized membrane protein (UPF0136 family)